MKFKKYLCVVIALLCVFSVSFSCLAKDNVHEFKPYKTAETDKYKYYIYNSYNYYGSEVAYFFNDYEVRFHYIHADCIVPKGTFLMYDFNTNELNTYNSDNFDEFTFALYGQKSTYFLTNNEDASIMYSKFGKYEGKFDISLFSSAYGVNFVDLFFKNIKRLVPLILALIVGFIAFRKGWEFIKNALNGA